MSIKSVAILGMGLSIADYTMASLIEGSRSGIADEIWGINAIGGTFQVDKVFMMDSPDSKTKKVRDALARYDWLKKPGCPIYSNREMPEVSDRFVKYPLMEVVNKFQTVYFSSSVAYAVAYALYIGVEELFLFGIDFNYVDNPQWSETGRGGTEYWLGMAKALGVVIHVANNSTLLGTNEPKFYGYGDSIELTFKDGQYNLKAGDKNDVTEN